MVTTPSALSKSTILQTIYGNIYDRLVDNVTSVSITGGVTITIQTYTNSFPAKSLDEKGDYPILVVEVPSLEWDTYTLTKKWANGTFTIDIYTTQSESADKFMDAIINSIEGYRDDLKAVQLHFVNLESIRQDAIQRAGFTLHLKSCTFGFKYIFTGSL